MKSFHKVKCPSCNHSFTFKEVKEKVKKGFLSRILDKVIIVVFLVILIFILTAGTRGLFPNESGVVKGFLPTLWDQTQWVLRLE